MPTGVQWGDDVPDSDDEAPRSANLSRIKQRKQTSFHIDTNFEPAAEEPQSVERRDRKKTMGKITGYAGDPFAHELRQAGVVPEQGNNTYIPEPGARRKTRVGAAMRLQPEVYDQASHEYQESLREVKTKTAGGYGKPAPQDKDNAMRRKTMGKVTILRSDPSAHALKGAGILTDGYMSNVGPVTEGKVAAQMTDHQGQNDEWDHEEQVKTGGGYGKPSLFKDEALRRKTMGKVTVLRSDPSGHALKGAGILADGYSSNVGPVTEGGVARQMTDHVGQHNEWDHEEQVKTGGGYGKPSLFKDEALRRKTMGKVTVLRSDPSGHALKGAGILTDGYMSTVGPIREGGVASQMRDHDSQHNEWDHEEQTTSSLGYGRPAPRKQESPTRRKTMGSKGQFTGNPHGQNLRNAGVLPDVYQTSSGVALNEEQVHKTIQLERRKSYAVPTPTKAADATFNTTTSCYGGGGGSPRKSMSVAKFQQVTTERTHGLKTQYASESMHQLISHEFQGLNVSPGKGLNKSSSIKKKKKAMATQPW